LIGSIDTSSLPSIKLTDTNQNHHLQVARPRTAGGTGS